ncbi:MAG: hypothetical protein ACOYZ7_03015 [Chloroflexota bacterium]
MNGQKRALLLVGSAKRPHSTSESLGRYLLGQLAGRGYETEALLIHRALKSDQGRGELLAAVERADLLLLAFPLYVDTLPALVIRALEAIAERRRDGQDSSGGRLVAIANCGFPEASHNDTALAICRRFAAEAGFEWAGGLALGGGQALSGRPLDQAGGMARHAVQALDLAAAALAAGDPLPQEAVVAMGQPIIPRRAYLWMGGLGWRLQARKHGAARRLRARPFDGG